MKANELMIGDLVLFNGNPKKVTSLLVTDLGIDQIYVFGKTCQVATISEYVEPILLTSEILEKNGYNHELLSGRALWTDEYTSLEEVEDLWEFTALIKGIEHVDAVLPSIRYVHELQHALRLCRIDKKIEL